MLLKIAAAAARWLPMGIKRGVYRYPYLARVIRSQLNRAAPEGLVEIQVASGLLAGSRLILDLQTEKDYWLGTYEAALQQALRDLVKPGMIAYDVGAGIGYITLMLAKVVGEGGRIFAFEALPSNLERLRENVCMNEMQNSVMIIPGAIMDHEGRAQFLVGPSGGMGKVSGSTGRQDVHYPTTIDVRAFTLDGFIYEAGNPTPDVMKMDIEGGEILAIPGMRRLLREAKPLIFLELHGPEAAAIAWRDVGEAGYTFRKIRRSYPPVFSLEELDWKEYLIALPFDR